MEVHFQQIYIEQNAYFPFSHIFQMYVSKQVSALVDVSPKFLAKFGESYELTFNVSAKHSLGKSEIRGPTVFKKDKDVEYTIFLPYGVIMAQDHPPTAAALLWIFAGVYEVFERLEIDTSQVRLRQHEIVEHILSDPTMFQDLKYVKIFGSDAVIERVGYEHLDPEVWKAK